jgi:hypothetical protein
MTAPTFSQLVKKSRCPFYVDHPRLVFLKHDRWPLFTYYWCARCRLMFNVTTSPPYRTLRYGIAVTRDVGNKWLRTCVIFDDDPRSLQECVHRVKRELA